MGWSSCLFRPTRAPSSLLEVNPVACPSELHEQLIARGTACIRPRGTTILYERDDDGGQGAFTPPVLVYIKRLPFSDGLEVCVKRTLVTHFIGRAIREARLQVGLQHPHLLPAYASVRGRHHYYLVLPAAEEDLWAEAEALRAAGRGYNEAELRSVARQLLLGLEHLHGSSLAHRDIKPANLLRLRDGRVVVADFGCADAASAGFVAAGTTQYQPPECRRVVGARLAVLPKGYDQRAQDMWGVGATLASLWFGEMPQVVRPRGSDGGGVGGGGDGGGGGGDSGRGRGRGGGGSGTSGGNASGGSNAGSSGGGGGAPAGGIGSLSGMYKVASAGAVDRLAGGGLAEPPLADSGYHSVTSTAYGGGIGGAVAAATPATDDGDAPAAGAASAVGPAAGAATSASGTLPGRPPLPVPRFLATAGFAFLSSTVGACGAPMSPELQDFLSALLRLRPADRLTASAALQHPWLAAAEAEGGAAAAGRDVARMADVAVQLPPQAGCTHAAGLAPSAVAAESVAVALPPRRRSPAASSASPSSSPLKRLLQRRGGGGDGRLSGFLSHNQLLRHRAGAGQSESSTSASLSQHTDPATDATGSQSDRGWPWHRARHAPSHEHQQRQQQQQPQEQGHRYAQSQSQPQVQELPAAVEPGAPHLQHSQHSHAAFGGSYRHSTHDGAYCESSASNSERDREARPQHQPRQQQRQQEHQQQQPHPDSALRQHERNQQHQQHRGYQQQQAPGPQGNPHQEPQQQQAGSGSGSGSGSGAGSWSDHLPQWLRSAVSSHAQQHKPKRGGGRKTLCVFVGAGADNAGGSS